MNEKTYKQYIGKLEIICWDLRKEKEKLLSQLEQKEDNWNKLKEWLEKEKENRKYANDVERFTAYGSTLDKMQEIEGGMNE